EHTCATSATTGTHCWGFNLTGLLGDGTTDNRRGVVRVLEPQARGTSVSVGNRHSCILTKSSAVYCWGDNRYGAVGDGSRVNRIAPTPVIGLSSGVVAVSAGVDFSCALTNTGNVLCWGSNYWGSIGDGTSDNRLVPTPVVGLELPAVAISAGRASVCAITSNQSVLCWGGFPRHSSDANAIDERHAPRTVPGLETGVVAVSSGNGHTCAITDYGSLKCWGTNRSGQLGDGTHINREFPTQVLGLESDVIAVSAGSGYTCAIRTPGTTLCWGSNAENPAGRGVGCLGDGTRANRLIPTPVQVSP
ncbi:MAG: RCC1 repeat-containing protein, partial [Polyangiaceae bacterium]|nr:RCC1 repeat-containing protein [Polyangiaceae bacterium]